MEFLLLRLHKEGELELQGDESIGEEPIFVGRVKDPELGEISINAIPLRREIPGWLKQSTNRVFHTVNGQVQHKQSRGHLSQICGFPAFKDRVVIIIDSSNLTFGAHNEVWKGDREHISNTIVGERYTERINAAIKESEALKELQNKIAEQELQRVTKTESNSLFQGLIDKDRNLANLLSHRDPTIRLPSSGGNNGGEGGKGEFEGKYSPTFLRLDERFIEKQVEIPINKTRPIAGRTDAENGYLGRADNVGRVQIDAEVREKFGIREHLHDGRLTIYLEPLQDDINVGDSFTATIGLQDDAMPAPVESVPFTIKIVDAVLPPSKPKKPKKKTKKKSGDGGNAEGQGQDAPTHGLPKCVLLTKAGREVNGYAVEVWPEDFTEHDGGLIEDLGSEIIYKINYDNAYHLKYRMDQRGDVARDAVTEKYILGMRILMLGYEHALSAIREKGNGNGEGAAEFFDDFRRMAARGAASTVLALAENLPKIVDKSSAEEVVE